MGAMEESTGSSVSKEYRILYVCQIIQWNATGRYTARVQDGRVTQRLFLVPSVLPDVRTGSNGPTGHVKPR